MMTVEEARNLIQRPVEATATELKNNFIAMRDWQQDARIYCMCHCRVYDNIDDYISAVNALL